MCPLGTSLELLVRHSVATNHSRRFQWELNQSQGCHCYTYRYHSFHRSCMIGLIFAQLKYIIVSHKYKPLKLQQQTTARTHNINSKWLNKHKLNMLLPKIILAIWFVLNEPEQIKSWQQCRRQLNVLLHRLLWIVAAEGRVCCSQNGDTSIQACHDTSLQQTAVIH